MARWCIPGVPLVDGAGWRLWYSQPGSHQFTVKPVVVQTLDQQEVDVDQSPPLFLPDLDGLNRKIAIVDVRLKQPAAGQEFFVSIPELGRTYRWWTRPDQVPPNGISFILASCFWRNDDGGYFRKAIAAIMDLEKPRPAFKLLVGDQVYLDFPVSLNPFASPEEVTADRYFEYWGDADYRESLLAAPNFFTCDDHEFWNDYPEQQIHLARTRGDDRERYAELADQYYNAFQHQMNASDKRWYTFDISPASFFVTDSRSTRDFFESDVSSHFLPAQQWEDLETWQRELRGPGFLVLGQPLFQEDGNWKDHSLSNYVFDYDRLLQLIEESLNGQNDEGRRHDIVILSGDIHTGRYTWASVATTSRVEAKVHEIIASPSSRIGPFTREPSPQTPPGRIPPSPSGRRLPWKVNTSTWRPSSYFDTIENNVGLIRLLPSASRAYRLRLEFSSYLVRPHRLPSWKIFSREPSVDFRDKRHLQLNRDTKIELDLL